MSFRPAKSLLVMVVSLCGFSEPRGDQAMRSKRSVRLEAKWRKIFAEHPRSGQTIRAYCKARHVTEGSFFFWRSEMERLAQPLAVGPQLSPIRILPDFTLRMQVRCPLGHVVRLSSHDGSLLSNLFRALNGGVAW